MSARRFPRPQVFVPARYFADTPSALNAFLFVDCRYSLLDPHHHGPTQHKLSRPAGAVLAEIESPSFCGDTSRVTARHPLPETGPFIAWCQRHGLGKQPQGAAEPKVPICFDDQGSGLAASRVWWMLQNLGLEAYILDGGFQQYKATGLPLVSGAASEGTAPGASTPAWPYAREWSHIVNELVVLDPSVSLVDARTADRYGSALRPNGLDAIAGHLPNAVNHPWPSNLTPADPKIPTSHNVLKPTDVLKAQMSKSYGKGDATNTVFMCASGVTACINVAVSTHLGLGTPRLFVNGWSGLCGSSHDNLLSAALSNATAEHGGVTVEVLKADLAAPLYDARIDAVDVNGRVLEAPVDPARLPAAVQKVVKFLKVGEPVLVHEKGVAPPTKVTVVRRAAAKL